MSLTSQDNLRYIYNRHCHEYQCSSDMTRVVSWINNIYLLVELRLEVLSVRSFYLWHRCGSTKFENLGVLEKALCDKTNARINFCWHIFSQLLLGGSRSLQARMLLRGLVDCCETKPLSLLILPSHHNRLIKICFH
jgi:hypothetical protein